MHTKMSPELDKLILVLTTIQCVVLVDQKQRRIIQNKIGREDEQIHLEIHSIFAQMIGKTMEDFSSSFVGGNIQYKIKR